MGTSAGLEIHYLRFGLGSIVFLLGFVWFRKTKGGFADVL